jgi:pyruvate formate lyase activating enzyme
MTGMIFDIKKFSMHDGPGVRITVFFKGCEMRCPWCFNPEGREPYPSVMQLDDNGKEKTVGEEYTVDELMMEILEEKNVMTVSGGGVTFSGGEPLFQHRFLGEIIDRCSEEGIHVAVDTSGYCEPKDFLPAVKNADLVLFDIKHTDNKKHLSFTAVSTKYIHENLNSLLTHTSIPVWLRIPVIPGFNHSKEEMKKIIRYLSSLSRGIEQVQLIPYQKTAMEKCKQLHWPVPMSGIESVKKKALQSYVRMFKKAGYKTIIGG